MRWSVVPALGFFLYSAPGGSAPPADALLGQIEHCLARLDDAGDTGTIESSCGAAVAAIENSGWTATLPEDSAGRLTSAELESLRALTEAYREVRLMGPALRYGTLDDVLAELKPERIERELTTWQKIGRWLRERFGFRFETPSFFKRVADWLEPFGEPVAKAAGWLVLGLMAALIIAAVIVTAYSLRRARLIRQAAGDPGRTPAAGSDGAEQPSLAELGAMRPEAALRRLLEYVLAALYERRRLPAYRALTVRQIAQAALVASDEQRAALQLIARSAEQVTFGNWRPAAADSAALIAVAGGLLAGLPAAEPAR